MNKYDKSSLRDIADKTTGNDSLIVFDALIYLGKACTADMAKNRPKMTIVYKNLQNTLTSGILLFSNHINNDYLSNYIIMYL